MALYERGAGTAGTSPSRFAWLHMLKIIVLALAGFLWKKFKAGNLAQSRQHRS